jgi:Tol biopolymer transport system component
MLTLALIMAFTLAACGGGIDNSTGSSDGGTNAPTANVPSGDNSGSGNNNASAPSGGSSNVSVSGTGENGTNAGNLFNYGYAAIGGDRIYFGSRVTWSLSSIKTDGSGLIQLCDEESAPEYINVVGDRIYYRNREDRGNIYTMKTDGSDKRALNDVSSIFITVVGDQIYYIATRSNFNIYKMNTDGSNVQKLNDEHSFNINVYGDRIYYVNDNEDVVSIRTDGSDRRVIIGDKNVYYINVVGGRIYYLSEFDNEMLYSMKTDGTDSIRVTDKPVGRFNVSGDRIYFVNHDDLSTIYSMNLNGGDFRRLNDHSSEELHVIGDFIYYTTVIDGKRYIYVMQTDGGGNRLLEQ